MTFSKDNIKKICCVIIFAIILYAGFQNIDRVFASVENLFAIVSPFIIGGAMAFVLKVPMESVENLLKKCMKKQKVIRPLSVLITLILVSGAIFAVCFMIIPEIVDTVISVGNSIEPFLDNLVIFINNNVDLPYVAEYLSEVDINWMEIANKTWDIVNQNMSSFFNTTITATTIVVGAIVNFFLAFIFSIYVLLQKETLKRQTKLLFKAFLPENIANSIIETARLSNDVFCKFISGQCLEAVILGSMFFISMIIFRLPYATLISVLIGFLSLIPIFGAFVGCGVGVFLILINSPSQALFFIIMFLVIQQIEGNLIYPHVVGGSIGLPSIWVLVAVTIGGNLMGVVGMLVFIPLSAIFYITLRKITYKKINQKQPVMEQGIDEKIEE